MAMSEAGISAGQFYGKKKSIAPVLRTGRGIEAALKAARSDPGRLYKLFPTQEQAFRFSDAHPHLKLHTWSYEIDGKGKRRFVVASFPSFWKWYRRCIRRSARLHFYEIIRNGAACKLYFDLEYNRSVNRNVDSQEMVRALTETVGQLCMQDVGAVLELDSTTEQKWSKHLIFQDVLFHDNIQVGEFVRRVCAEMETKYPKLLMVHNSHLQHVPFVDLAVYTKNRCFRVVGSSKFGKDTRLLPENHSQKGRLYISEELFFTSLVCNVSASAKLRGSPRPVQENSIVRRTYVSAHVQNVGRLQGCESASGFSQLDAYVMSIIRPFQGGIYGITHFRGSGTIMYAIRGGYKYCARIGRHHKSNNVILIADTPTRKMFQKCFDPDCRDFCSEPWDIPAQIFESKDSRAQTEELSDAALFALMNELDRRVLTAGSTPEHVPSEGTEELSDDVLNAVMDCVEYSIVA